MEENEFIMEENEDGNFSDFEDDCGEEEYDYDDDFQTWGQKRGLCDIADNCYGCPYAAECF
jgi:hypothetical protein